VPEFVVRKRRLKGRCRGNFDDGGVEDEGGAYFDEGPFQGFTRFVVEDDEVSAAGLVDAIHGEFLEAIA
jgi:hypothetical protein